MDINLDEMTIVYMGLLVRGPKAAEWDEKPDELARLQEAHLANMARIAETGKLLASGPFTDDGYFRGVYIFKVESVEEAEALINTDPAVQAGRLAFEIHPWMVKKGVIQGAD